jgi:hypothetical protein
MVSFSICVFALNKSIKFLDLISWHHKHTYNNIKYYQKKLNLIYRLKKKMVTLRVDYFC